MEITIKYAVTREEITEWYWKMWRKTLWKTHLIFFGLIMFFAISLDGHWPIQDYRAILNGILVSIGLFVFFVLFPQAMYKPQTRTVTVNETGIYTSIASKSKSVNWTEIKEIEFTPEHIFIVLKKTLNALIIPRRAFVTDNDRVEFLNSITTWHQNAQETK